MPGINNIHGLWPAVWTMYDHCHVEYDWDVHILYRGNLGRAGFGASLEGMWVSVYLCLAAIHAGRRS